jgi:hypothetical protein
MYFCSGYMNLRSGDMMYFCTRYMYFFGINVLNALRAPGMMVAQHTYICRRNTTVGARATAVRSTICCFGERMNQSSCFGTFQRCTVLFEEAHVLFLRHMCLNDIVSFVKGILEFGFTIYSQEWSIYSNLKDFRSSRHIASNE